MKQPFDDVRSFYDTLAPFYRRLVSMDEREIPSILSKLPATPGHALDLGCGVGRVAVPLAMAGWRVRGLDLSPAMLAEAALYAEAMHVSDRVSWTRADISDLGSWPRGKVDLIIAIGSLFHVSDDAALERILRAVFTSLRRDALFVVDMETENSAWITEPDEQECTIEHSSLTIRKNSVAVEDGGRTCVDLTVQRDGRLAETLKMQTLWSDEEAFRLRLKSVGLEVIEVQRDWGAAGTSGLLYTCRR